MTATTDKINAPAGAAPWARPHNWARSHAVADIPNANAHDKTVKNLVPTNSVPLTWKDMGDMINPLHQIPIVGDIYRSVTGKQISGLSRVLGGFLYGGLSGGFLASLTAAYAELHQGESPGEQIVAALITPDKAGPSAEPARGNIQLAAVDLPAAATQQLLAQGGAPPPTTEIANEKTPEAAPFAAPVMMASQTPALATEGSRLNPIELAASVANTTTHKAAEAAQPVPQPVRMATAPEPLRERLNRKIPSEVKTVAKPLDSYTAQQAVAEFASARTSGAAGGAAQLAQTSASSGQDLASRAAAQMQNLQLLQEFTESSAPSPASMPVHDYPTTIAAAASPGGRNPLPAQLVEDMMMLALDKYQGMKSGSGSGATLR